MARIIVSILLLLTSSCTFCEKDTFKIYYMPINARFYGVPYPEEVERKGLHLEMTSCAITKLFNKIDKGNPIALAKEFTPDLRIEIIRNRDGKVAWITTNKIVLIEGREYNINDDHSRAIYRPWNIYEWKRYDISNKVVNNAIDDIASFAKKRYKKWQDFDL